MTPEQALQARVALALHTPVDHTSAYMQQVAELKQAIVQEPLGAA